MQIKKINVGNVVIRNNVFLAPLAGYTNAVFRDMCYRLGAGLTFTEMVSAKGLCYGSEGTRELLYISPDYRGVNACQLFGGDPEYMERAAKSEYLASFEIIDINMGCPVPKVFKNGEGSALMADFDRASKIIKACKKSGKAVTVKFRTGLTGDKLVTRDFAKMCEDGGADLITIHGRTRDKIYSGEVNFAQIESAKSAVKIPVIANGGIFSPKDADELMNKTGADGVALARGAMYNPFLFAEIMGTHISDKKEVIRKQLYDTYAIYGERFATVYMRKMIGFYIKGTPNAVAVRERLLKCSSLSEIESELNSISF